MPGKVGGRPTGMNKRRIERIKEIMQKRKDKQMQKNKNEMSMMPEGAKKGAAIKIKKVAKGLEKASKTHAAQAKTLKSVKANKGTIVDKFFKDRVASEKRDIRKTEQMVGASISSKREKGRKGKKLVTLRVDFLEVVEPQSKGQISKASSNVQTRDLLGRLRTSWYEEKRE